MEFKEWIKNTGDFLNAKIVKSYPDERAKGRIVSVPMLVQKEIKGDKFWKLSMAVEIGDEHFIFDMSKRDSVEVSKEYGEDLENWSGKELIFSVIPTPLGDSVYAKAVKTASYPANKGVFRLKESV